ncbi:hypothetical protein JYU34_004342 [Plutella xylostella]|uniref:FLYWCH-type domain-containing protein n=1 Tax=Plutella xylostella TaxID=51655 RepID=A0ABQ7QXR8_PLUXY|nr:hypothetical protein JYU34_004342 [Plutella xylostella]
MPFIGFGTSQRGGRLLIVQGYSYSLVKRSQQMTQWRCTMVQPGTSKRCTAKVFTDASYAVIDAWGSHSHGKPRFVKRNNVFVRSYYN